MDTQILKEAIAQIEKIQNAESKNAEEIYKGIGLLGSLIGAETFLCKYLPKGQIMIGTGEKLHSV